MERQYVGIDLHRRRSVIVRMDERGEVLGVERIDNDPVALSLALAEAGPDPEVVIEATYGWYWAVDVLEREGATVHLAHSLGVKGFKNRRVKNDVQDATHLADLLRMDRLPESWVAPQEFRELRELVRYRAKLVALRTSAKNQVHSVLAKEGVRVPMTDLFGRAGSELLDAVPLCPVFRSRVQSLRSLVGVFDAEIGSFEGDLRSLLATHPGYRALQVIPGVGPVIAAVMVAEIGDVTRLPDPRRLASWAGLTPYHRESDTVVHRDHITKQGSRLVRWAAIEAVQRQPAGTKLRSDLARIGARRGKNIAKVAAARKLLALVYYALRDGEVRCLRAKEAA